PGSTARLEAKQHAKYRAGFGGVLRCTGKFTAPVAGTEQYIGFADEVGSSATFKNGYMIGYEGETFGIHRFSNDTKISVAQSSWDDPLDGTGASGMTLDKTKINVWFIEFQFLGAGVIRFTIEDEKGVMQPVHTIPYPNLHTEPSNHNPNFHFMMWVNNGATSSNIELSSSSYSYFVEGITQHTELHTPIFATGEQTKSAVTTETNLVTIRNKTTYVSKVNFIDVFLVDFRASVEATGQNNLAKCRLVKNAVLGGSPQLFIDVNTSDSVMEFNLDGTTVSGGVSLGDFPLAGKNDKAGSSLIHLGIVLNPGETLTIAGASASSATMKAGLAWHELF
ncbi:hypothetical protein LCGC14_2820220, partial [marine sediment metagenome]